MDDLFDDFQWHSSVGIDDIVYKNHFVTKMANNEINLQQFIAGGDKLLVHKTTKALWKFSDDKKSIVPVFSSDVLTEDDIDGMVN